MIAADDAGRTVWWAKDSAWWRRERIVALGEEFGPAGPAVIDWLSCEAKAQNDGGLVKAGYRTVSRGCFVEPVTVGHVLSRSVTLGLLDDFEESGGVFTCRLSGWRQDQDKGRAAHRKAVERARATDVAEPEPAARRRSTPSALSRSVTASPLQNRTEEKKDPPQPPAGGGSSTPLVGRRGERFRQDAIAWAETVGVSGRPASVLNAYRQAEPWRHNGDAVEFFHAFVEQHFPALTVSAGAAS